MNSILKVLSVLAITGTAATLVANATPQVIIERNQSPGQTETPLYYQFNTIPGNSASDLAHGITPLISGTPGTGGGAPTRLTDGFGALNSDDPTRNFWFFDGTPGPYIISLDLGAAYNIAQVNTYSWHHGNGVRAPQDYDLFASTGTAIGFNAANPSSPGWQLLTSVDTEIAGGNSLNAGQHGVSISDSTGSLGNYRYIALQVYPPDGYGHTFYSEIDVVAVPEPSVFGLVLIATVTALYRRHI